MTTPHPVGPEHEFARERARGPGIGLIVVGCAQLLYAGTNAFLSALMTIGSVVSVVGVLPQGPQDLGTYLWFWVARNAVIGLFQVAAYLPLVLLALLVVLAGTRLMALRSPGLVLAGAVAAVGIPVCGSATGCVSVVGFSFGGLLCGVLPGLIVFVLGAVAAVWALLVLRDPEVEAAMAQNLGAPAKVSGA
jgi:hypothetical protein